MACLTGAAGLGEARRVTVEWDGWSQGGPEWTVAAERFGRARLGQDSHVGRVRFEWGRGDKFRPG